MSASREETEQTIESKLCGHLEQRNGVREASGRKKERGGGDEDLRGAK